MVENKGKLESAVKIACFGVAFKADIDDLRESPALAITKKITDGLSAAVRVVEPNVSKLPASLDRCELVSIEAGLESDIVVVLVDHKEFKKIKPRVKFLIDTKGIWE